LVGSLHVKDSLIGGQCLPHLLLCLRLVYQRHPKAAVVSKVVLHLKLCLPCRLVLLLRS
jgi:hypothetical protein